jgi:type II restriction enzyme
MDVAAGHQYKSASQRARVITESWARDNLYCVSCDAQRLTAAPTNTQAIDFTCDACSSPYQLKSQSTPLGRRIVDAGYAAMCRAVLRNQTPNLIVLHYNSRDWRVQNAILVPAYAFSLSAIEARKPLAKSARRAGWIGCNILLCNIPLDVRIPLVMAGTINRFCDVRHHYQSMAAIKSMGSGQRGWLLDVLNVARSLQRCEFSLNDIYKHERYLEALHPKNLNVRPKIRQQLQKIRDMGLIDFLGDGTYRWVRSPNA